MAHALLITVRFHDGYYHGAGDWPPAPARLFQALVAGAAVGEKFLPDSRQALEWFERLDPPDIVAPPARAGQGYRNYVPNNDLDAVGGNPDRIAEIRAPKQVRPRLFDAEIPLLYLWYFEDGGEKYARTLLDITECLYQLGRGVDMAWATAELLSTDEAEKRLTDHGGMIHRRAPGEGVLLASPAKGSLESLIVRHHAVGERLRARKAGRGVDYLFSQPPKPRFVQIAYDSSPDFLLYDLRDLSRGAGFQSWPLCEAAKLVEVVRDTAADRFKKALPEKAAVIDRVFIGRNAVEADKAQRIRVIPLPSIGHPHADSSIRRVLLEIPPDCPVPRGDVAWAFSGLHLGADPETGEIRDETMPMLVEADDWRMPDHYGIEQRKRQNKRVSRVWRTVTPAALPERAGRRRIDPARIKEEAKGVEERLKEEGRAVAAVYQAVRHAGVDTLVEHIRVQREPFRSRGTRAENFAAGTRFSKHRLWHVEIAFTEARTGPLVIGDGRYLGLGLMTPEQEVFRHVAVFSIESIAPPKSARSDILKVLRRALMAVDRDLHGTDKPSKLFSGHEPDGSPAGNGHHEHVFLAADTGEGGDSLARLYVIRPDVADLSIKLPNYLKLRFERVVTQLKTVRAGQYGILQLHLVGGPTPDDCLFATAKVWQTYTEYRPTRHPKKDTDIDDWLKRDVLLECIRRGLPKPKVAVVGYHKGVRGGILAKLMLEFAIAVQGPIILGSQSHVGQGSFYPKE